MDHRLRDLQRSADTGNLLADVELIGHLVRYGQVDQARARFVGLLSRWRELLPLGLAWQIDSLAASGRDIDLMARLRVGYVADGAAVDGKWWSRGAPDQDREIPGAWLQYHAAWMPYYVVAVEPGAPPFVSERAADLSREYPPRESVMLLFYNGSALHTKCLAPAEAGPEPVPGFRSWGVRGEYFVWKRGAQCVFCGGKTSKPLKRRPK